MKIFSSRFKSIFKFVLIAFYLMVLLVICWIIYINYHGDEAPDAGRDEFYARATTIIPDNQNIAVATSGITAPISTDIINHGRFVIDAYQNNLLSGSIKNKTFNSMDVKFVGKREEFDCWLYDELEKRTESCANQTRIQELLAQNKLLLERYKSLYKMRGWQGLSSSSGQTILDLNRLLATDIRLDIGAGNDEAAYQKWKNNTVFINHILKQETITIDKAIFMVIDGFNLASLEYLLLKNPQIMAKNHDELMILLSPAGLTKYNLQGMLKADYHFYEDSLFKTVTPESKVHVNYIRNRIYRVHIDLLKEAQKSPFTFEASKNILHQRYYFGRYQLWNLDLLDPMNGLLSSQLVNGALSSFHLVESMHSKSALVKLLNLKINIHQHKIADADIQTFLNNAGSELFNPFTNKPMHWNATKRALICNRPNTDESPIELKL